MKQTFKMHVHDVCSKFASSCKQGISCTWRGTAPCADLAYTGSLAVTPLGWDAMYSVHQSLVVTIITTSDNVTHTTNVCTSNYYGAVLPRRRSHYVSMLSVCPSVRPSVPCLHLEKKQKGLGRPNLVGRIPGTRAPRGPISRFPAVGWVGRPYPKASVPRPRGKTKRPTYTKLGRKGPWDTSTPRPITRSMGQRSRSRRLIALFAKKSP